MGSVFLTFVSAVGFLFFASVVFGLVLVSYGMAWAIWDKLEGDLYRKERLWSEANVEPDYSEESYHKAS